MEELFNTCNALRDKLLLELHVIKRRISPRNNVSAHAMYRDAGSFEGIVLQTPGVNLHRCFSSEREANTCMLQFIQDAANDFDGNLNI